MKKTFAVVLSCLFASALFAAKTPKAEFIVIESDVYAAGKQDPQLVTGISGFLGLEPAVTTLSVAQAKADPKMANLNFDYLPLYLIKKTSDIRKKMEEPLAGGYVKENADYLILEKQGGQGVYTNMPAKPGVLEIFVMSQCPYGAMAENLVIAGERAGRIPQDKQIKLRYIVNYNPMDDSFSSMHGSAEWEENIRQLLIEKYYPAKLWKYLEIRNKDYQSSRWDKAMEEAGINVNKIMKKFDTEGKELLKEEAKYGQLYGIQASPSFLWEGQVKLDFNTVSELEGFGFLNPNLYQQDQQQGGGAAQPGSC